MEGDLLGYHLDFIKHTRESNFINILDMLTS